jgi:hypothetical protein
MVTLFSEKMHTWFHPRLDQKFCDGIFWGSLKPEDFIYRIAGPAERGGGGTWGICSPALIFWQNMPTILGWSTLPLDFAVGSCYLSQDEKQIMVC